MTKLTHLKSAAALAGILVPLAWSGVAWAQDAINLRMTTWSANEAHLTMLNGIAADFKATHPNVNVTYESLPFDTYTTTLTTQIAGGNAPDLAWIFETTAVDFVNSGALFPLTDTFNTFEGYDFADVTPGPLQLWSRDNVLYAFPFSTSPFGVFVNNDLITAAGAKTPAEMIAAGDWTWDNAIATAATVAQGGKSGLIVRDFDYKTWQNLTAIYAGWGATPWSEDGKTCTFTDPKMVAAMTFIHDAIFTKKAMPGPGETADFFAGDAAMTVTQISRASLLPKENPFDWDLVQLPAGPDGAHAMIGQAAIGVFASSPNAQAAAEFLAFLTNPANSAKLSQFFPSARKSLLTAEALGKTNPLLSPAQLEAVVIDGISNGKVIPGHAGFAQIQQTVRAGLDAIWVADADIPAAMQSICDSITPLLAQ
jgi:multiple sugar transport system substrate-binding protein